MKKDVVGYENLYVVSNAGEVFKFPDRNKKQTLGKRGYFTVSLYKNGQRKTATVHRLAAKAFIPNPQDKPFVNHKDGNKLNNCVDNLEWVTGAENKIHSFRVLGERHWLKGKTGADCMFSKAVEMIDPKTNEVIACFAGAHEAARELKTSQGNISAVCANKRAIAAGYKWRFKQ